MIKHIVMWKFKDGEEENMKKFLEEFKSFALRGNVMDMAVGIIIGGAFTSIVTSLVNDIINPILGVFGGMNSELYINAQYSR